MGHERRGFSGTGAAKITQQPFYLTVLGKPVPAAQKHARANGQKFMPARQRLALEDIRKEARELMVDRDMLEGPLELSLLAVLPIPDSKSKKFKTGAMSGEILPTKIPDLKNLLWLAEDALSSVVFADDKQICRYGRVEKIYGVRPRIEITLREI